MSSESICVGDIRVIKYDSYFYSNVACTATTLHNAGEIIYVLCKKLHNGYIVCGILFADCVIAYDKDSFIKDMTMLLSRNSTEVA